MSQDVTNAIKAALSKGQLTTISAASIKASVATSMEEVKEAVHREPDYAYSWHANLAVCAQDEGISYDKSQQIASRFMKLLFDLDTSEIHQEFHKSSVDKSGT